MKKFLTIFTSILITSVLMFSCNEMNTDNSGISSASADYQNPKSGSIQTDETMTLAPYKLVLNANGKDQTVQIIFGGYMPSGYRIYDFDIALYFADEFICNAISFRYCYVDHNYLGEFDRDEIQDNDYVQSLAGTTTGVTASGTYTLINSENETIEVSFSKFAYCEVVKPGKK